MKPRGPIQLLGGFQVFALSVASVLARLPVGMTAVGIVIFVHAHAGSFGLAGLLAGAYSLSFAVAGPFLARLVDRRGTRAVLVPASFVCAAGLVGLVLGVQAGAADGIVLVATVVSGAATPPITGVLRRAWPQLVAEEDLIGAFALDSILVEVVFISGPLLVGLLVASVGPAAPLLVGAAGGLLGTLLFVSLEGTSFERDPRSKPTWGGGLTSPTIRYIALSGVPTGVTFGALEVALPAFGVERGQAALGGLLVVCLALGSLLGALIFAIDPERLGDHRQGIVRLAIAQPFLAIPLLVSPAALVPVILLSMIAAVYAGPGLTIRSRVAQRSMPPGTETETFTWLLLAGMVGVSASSALTGPLVQAGGWRLGVAVAVVGPVLWLPFIILRKDLIPRR